MAYIPQDDDNQQNKGMNVLGQDGINQSAPAQQKEQASPSPSGGSGSVIGANQGSAPAPAAQAPNQAAQAPKTQPKKGVGSGLFTDLRKYVRANQPAAQNIAGAVQKKAGQQAQQLGKEVQQQQSNFQQRVAENRARMQAAQQFGQQQITQAGQQQAPEDVSKFRDLLTEKQSYETAGPFDVSQQSNQAQRMARQAALAGRASGTPALLQQTFGDRGYSRGQQALDELILSGAQPTRRDMVENLRTQAQDLTGQIRDARTQNIAESQALRTGGQDLRESLQQQLTGAREGLTSDIESEVIRQREALSSQQQELVDALNRGEVTAEQLSPFLDQASLDQVVNQMNRERDFLFNTGETVGGFDIGRAEELLGSSEAADTFKGLFGSDRDDLIDMRELRGPAYEDAAKRMTDFAEKFGTTVDGRAGVTDSQIKNTIASDPLLNLYFRDPDKARSLGITDQLVNQTLTNFQDPLQFADENRSNRLSQDKEANELARRQNQIDMQNRINQFKQQLQAGISGQPQTRDELINRFVQEANRQGRQDLGGFAQFADPESITGQNVITEEQLARQNALAALAGQEGTGIRERVERDATPGQYNLLDAMRRLGI